MKLGTTELIKFQKLQRRLKEPKRSVIGILELLWAATAKQAPRGDIGKFDNEDIAAICDWDGDPDELVEHLVATKWLDRHSEHRLIVHDWPQHAPGFVHSALQKRGVSFCSPDASPECSGDCSPEDSPDNTGAASTRTRLPSQAKPSQVKSSLRPDASAEQPRTTTEAKARKFDPLKQELPFASERFRESWSSWCRHRSQKRKPLTEESVKLQFGELLEWGEDRACAAIKFSIVKGYEGIFEERGNGKSRSPPAGESKLDAAMRKAGFV